MQGGILVTSMLGTECELLNSSHIYLHLLDYSLFSSPWPKSVWMDVSCCVPQLHFSGRRTFFLLKRDKPCLVHYPHPIWMCGAFFSSLNAYLLFRSAVVLFWQFPSKKRQKHLSKSMTTSNLGVPFHPQLYACVVKLEGALSRTSHEE